MELHKVLGSISDFVRTVIRWSQARGTKNCERLRVAMYDEVDDRVEFLLHEGDFGLQNVRGHGEVRVWRVPYPADAGLSQNAFA